MSTFNTPKLTESELAGLIDADGCVHLQVSVPRDFYEDWVAAKREEDYGETEPMMNALDELLVEIFPDGNLPETREESLDVIEDAVLCDFSFKLD